MARGIASSDPADSHSNAGFGALNTDDLRV